MAARIAVTVTARIFVRGCNCIFVSMGLLGTRISRRSGPADSKAQY
jgi:hypothetical protein